MKHISPRRAVSVTLSYVCVYVQGSTIGVLKRAATFRTDRADQPTYVCMHLYSHTNRPV